MPLKLDSRKVSECPYRPAEKMKCQGRSTSKARCSHPKHGGLCGYDGKTFLWRCKFGAEVKGGGDRYGKK